jgi:hypothetical protein
MTTSLAEGLDTTLDDLLAYEFDVPCDLYELQCSKPAEWKVIGTCCADITLLCQGHVDALWRAIEKNIPMKCDKCGWIGTADRYVFLIERL